MTYVRRRLVVGNLKVGGAVSGRSIGEAFIRGEAPRRRQLGHRRRGRRGQCLLTSVPCTRERGTHCRRYCFVHDKDKSEFFVIMNQLMTTGHG